MCIRDRFRDMKMMGELTSGAAARTMLYAKGATEDQAMAYLQPIVIDTLSLIHILQLYFFACVLKLVLCNAGFGFCRSRFINTFSPVPYRYLSQQRNIHLFSQFLCAFFSEDLSLIHILQEGKIYGFFYLPKGLSAEAQSQRQPTISFYTNYSYLIAGSLLFRDMKMMGELTSGAAARTMLYAKGATEDQAMAYLQPIVIDTHPLNNPWLNYSVYLCNTSTLQTVAVSAS